MSAFIVTNDHINALVTAHLASANELHSMSQTEKNSIGQMLLNENFRSVNTRYCEATQVPSFVFTPVYSYIPRRSGGLATRVELTPVALLKLLDSYEYQSCETNDFETTDAYKFCKSLRNMLISQLSNYEDSPWTI